MAERPPLVDPPAYPLGVDPSPRLDLMDGPVLDTAKTRTELAKLTYEYQEQRSWRWKLLFTSIVAPFGSVLLLFFGWYGAKVTERRHETEDMYTRAAKALSSANDPSVRLSAVKTLDQMMHASNATLFGGVTEFFFTSRTTRKFEEERRQETMALLIGSLSREKDASVLDAIAEAAHDHAEEAAGPLISMNKTGAVVFSRAAGEFAGLAILNRHHARMMENDDASDEDRKKALSDINVSVLRTGSPFQISGYLNQRFSSRDMLTNNHCDFREVYDLQRLLTMGAGLNAPVRLHAPGVKELKASMADVLSSAATLERSSYILGKLLNDDAKAGTKGARKDKILDALKEDRTRRYDLTGSAVVLGEVDQAAVEYLKKHGSYFNSSMYSVREDNLPDPNPGCRP